MNYHTSTPLTVLRGRGKVGGRLTFSIQHAQASLMQNFESECISRKENNHIFLRSSKSHFPIVLETVVTVVSESAGIDKLSRIQEN